MVNVSNVKISVTIFQIIVEGKILDCVRQGSYWLIQHVSSIIM